MAQCFPVSLNDIPPLDGPTLNFWKLAHTLPDGWRAWIALRTRSDGHDFLFAHNYDRLVFVTHITDKEQIAAAAAGVREIKSALPECTAVLASKTLGADAFSGKKPPGVPFWDSAKLRDPARFLAALSRVASVTVSPDSLQALRARIAPEIVIPPRNTGLRAPHASAAAPGRIAAYALDYLQEDVLKRDLSLSQEGRDAVAVPRGRLVTGVAGCGKSLVLLHRVKLLRELNPSCRCLLTTHNKPLSRELRRRYKRLSADDDRAVELRTFASWCLLRLAVLGHKVKVQSDIIKQRSRQELVQYTHDMFLDGTSISPEMLGEEFGWIKDNLVHEREMYLQADRTGRGFPLYATMRNRVHDAFTMYQQRLAETGQCDWDDIPCRLWRLTEQGVELWQYDAILADEAQFFPLVAFNLLKKVLKPGGQLLLAADPTQGFLRRRLSWLGMGVDIRGRSHNLTVCYRTTRGILKFAASFYKNRLPDEDAEVFLPEKSVLESMDAGKPPLMEFVNAPQEEQAMVLAAARKLIAEGAQTEDILILHANGMAVPGLVNFLQSRMKSTPVIDLREQSEGKGNEMKVCSLEAATGLEAPVVMVLGIDALLQKEDDPRMSSEERANLVKANTKRLYMSFTRAASRLVVFLPHSYSGHPWFTTWM